MPFALGASLTKTMEVRAQQTPAEQHPAYIGGAFAGASAASTGSLSKGVNSLSAADEKRALHAKTHIRNPEDAACPSGSRDEVAIAGVKRMRVSEASSTGAARSSAAVNEILDSPLRGSNAKASACNDRSQETT
jgi:hypothetical protein